MHNKVVVTVAVCGANTRKGTGKGMTPYLPITPDEIAEEAKRCYDAGASIIHIHARDSESGLTYPAGKTEENRKVFKEIIEKIRAKCPILINTTCAGGIGQTNEEKLVPLEFKPEIASFTSGSLIYGLYSKSQKEFVYDVGLEMDFKTLKMFADRMMASNVKPECEVYCHSHLNNLKIIEEKFKKPLLIQFVMGMPGQITPATPRNLIRLVDAATEMFEDLRWGVCAVGLVSWQMITLGAMLGATTIRTGMEDNIYLEPGVLARSNGEMVEKAIYLARAMGREIASVQEARDIIGG